MEDVLADFEEGLAVVLEVVELAAEGDDGGVEQFERMLILLVVVLLGELVVLENVARQVRSIVLQQLARSLHVRVLVLYSLVDDHLRQLVIR